MDKVDTFRGLDEEPLLKIAEITAEVENWKKTLDQLFQNIRPKFIFDNVVIYLSEPGTNRLDVIYARATGRGKSSGEDIAWGEGIANHVITEGKMLLEVPSNPPQANRLESPHILGMPISLSKRLAGVLVFIRFGGPEFVAESIPTARYISAMVTSLIRQKCLEDFDEKLESQRNSSRLQEDFINTISHELRSPLGFIKGYTTTLLREDASWDENTRHDFLEIIERESNNLTELIDNLLDSSRLQSGQMRFDMQAVRIDTLIRDEVSRSAITHPDQVVKLNFTEGLPPIQGDARRLAQVFDNLIGNSHKYAPGAMIFVSTRSDGKNIVIDYSDNGPGIPEKYLPQIFSRFFRSPDQAVKVHGTGLGLSICKQIIESHQGDIKVSSPPGSGAHFTITLPLV